MARTIDSRYRDPLEVVWVGVAERVGFRIRRSSEVYASFDGRKTILIGTAEVLDPDDNLAQMILHELCHALVQGPEQHRADDWGLDNQTDRDLESEHACLRLQAALTRPHGLRRILAPTTEHRAYYDRLPEDPLGGSEPAVLRARIGWHRADRYPFAPELSRALAATATIAEALGRYAGPDDLFGRRESLPRTNAFGAVLRNSGELCRDCAWAFDVGTLHCRQHDVPIEGDDPACEHFETPFDCQDCAACCREAYGAVELGAEGPALQARYPDLVVERDGRLALRRIKHAPPAEHCAALEVRSPARKHDHSAEEPGVPTESTRHRRFHCRIYEERPSSCRDFARGGKHCLTARRRLGLSR
ncbi:MAG: YkgJ family cysteine cluster protein [Myxococcota bacterium]